MQLPPLVFLQTRKLTRIMIAISPRVPDSTLKTFLRRHIRRQTEWTGTCRFEQCDPEVARIWAQKN